jgi:hypothetical protein
MKLGPYLLGPNDTPENGIYCGDARELAKAIPDESVDLIFTDPPYSREYLHLFGWLAKFGARVLKPGGFLFAMSGKYHLDKVWQQMSGKGLDYYWQIDLHIVGDATTIFPRRIVTQDKPVLLWSKGSATIQVWNMVDVYKGQGKAKRYHEWEQDVGIARYCIEYALGTGAGAVVVEPFTGGGSTIEACQILGLSWLAFDNDKMAVEATRARTATFIPPLFTLEPQQTEMEL